MHNVHIERDIKVMRFQSQVDGPRVPNMIRIIKEIESIRRRNLVKERG